MHEKSITLLNNALKEEILALNQYMYFHFHADDQGLDNIALLFKRIAIEEMRHVEFLAERILFLKGEVEMNIDVRIEKETDVSKMLKISKDSEEDAVKLYNKYALEAGNNADSVSKKLFEQLIADEERHYSMFDDELENLTRYGDKYLTIQSIERSKSNTSSLLSPQQGGAGA